VPACRLDLSDALFVWMHVPTRSCTSHKARARAFCELTPPLLPGSWHGWPRALVPAVLQVQYKCLNVSVATRRRECVHGDMKQCYSDDALCFCCLGASPGRGVQRVHYRLPAGRRHAVVTWPRTALGRRTPNGTASVWACVAYGNRPPHYAQFCRGYWPPLSLGTRFRGAQKLSSQRARGRCRRRGYICSARSVAG